MVVPYTLRAFPYHLTHPSSLTDDCWSCGVLVETGNTEQKYSCAGTIGWRDEQKIVSRWMILTIVIQNYHAS